MATPERTARYTDRAAVREALRCLQCEEAPCTTACPAGVDCAAFIGGIASGDLTRSIDTLKAATALPLVCGLICPVERLCEQGCTHSQLNYPITIGRLQSYAAEVALERDLWQPEAVPATGRRVAVVGGGPSGLACAETLTLLGHEVTLFERGPRIGGLLVTGIPEWRLPRGRAARELDPIAAGIAHLVCETAVEDLDRLFAQGFAAVYLAVGLGAAGRAGIPGEDSPQVTTALDFLSACNCLGPDGPPAVPGQVCIIGGGSVAMDAAGAAFRCGAQKVELVCLEAPNEMPAVRSEIAQAWHEGVIFHTRYLPREILLQDGNVAGLRAVAIEWQEPGLFVPRNAVPIEGTELRIACRMIIEAVGQRPDDAAQKLVRGLEAAGGRVKVDELTGATSRPGVYAGGDIILGSGLSVVRAARDGKRAAEAIAAWLSSGGGAQ